MKKYIDKLIDVTLTTLGIFKYYLYYCRSDRFNEEQISRLQSEKLRRLLTHCNRHVPYYTELFRAVGVNVNAKDIVGQFNKIPILTKDVVRENYDRLISFQKTRPLSFTTSGTSGHPLTFYTSKSQWIAEQAIIWRSWKRAGYNFRDKVAILRSYKPDIGEKKIKIDGLRNWRYYSPYHLSENDLEEYFHNMKDWGVKYIRGYPSSIKIFVDFLKKHELSLPGLKGVFTASEKLPKEYRVSIENILGVKVFDHYGQAEITAMYHSCEYGDVMHEDWEYGISEFVRLQNEPTSRLIATNLDNYSMPLIRYDTGDLVVVSVNKCRCNRNGFQLEEIFGRNVDFIYDQNFVKRPIVNLYTQFAKLDLIKSYQIRQSAPGEIQVSLELWDTNQEAEPLISYIKDYFHSYFMCFASIDFNNFKVSREGKRLAFLSSVEDALYD